MHARPLNTPAHSRRKSRSAVALSPVLATILCLLTAGRSTLRADWEICVQSSDDPVGVRGGDFFEIRPAAIDRAGNATFVGLYDSADVPFGIGLWHCAVLPGGGRELRLVVARASGIEHLGLSSFDMGEDPFVLDSDTGDAVVWGTARPVEGSSFFAILKYSREMDELSMLAAPGTTFVTDGGETTISTVAPPQGASTWITPRAVAGRIVFVAFTDDGSTGHIVLADADGSLRSLRALNEAGAERLASIALSPSGRVFAEIADPFGEDTRVFEFFEGSGSVILSPFEAAPGGGEFTDEQKTVTTSSLGEPIITALVRRDRVARDSLVVRSGGSFHEVMTTGENAPGIPGETIGGISARGSGDRLGIVVTTDTNRRALYRARIAADPAVELLAVQGNPLPLEGGVAGPVLAFVEDLAIADGDILAALRVVEGDGERVDLWEIRPGDSYFTGTAAAVGIGDALGRTAPSIQTLGWRTGAFDVGAPEAGGRAWAIAGRASARFDTGNVTGVAVSDGASPPSEICDDGIDNDSDDLVDCDDSDCDCEPTIVSLRPTPLGTAPEGQEVVTDLCDSAAVCAYGCGREETTVLHNGEKRVDRIDLVVPGRGEIHFRFTRRYRSRLDYCGPLGHGWDHGYNESLFSIPTGCGGAGVNVAPGDGVVYRNDGAGHVDAWTPNGDGSYAAPTGHFSSLHRQESGEFVLRMRDGFKRFYDAAGRLTAREDRHGNRMVYLHDEQGNLTRVVDAYGRDYDFEYELIAGGYRLVALNDFAGRTVRYRYDEEGHLVEVTKPAITGTSTANDFPDGKTERYTYWADSTPPELRDNLTSITYPEEVARGGPPAHVYMYGTDPADPMTFDKIIADSIGGGRTNHSGVPAGGDVTYVYESLNRDEPPGQPGLPRGKVTITERNGNILEYFADERNHHVLTRRRTRGLREGEPEFYETSSSYTDDGLLRTRRFPAGNRVEYVYDAGGVRAAQRNVIEVRRIADPERGGEDIVTSFTYEPLYQQIASKTDPRGNSPEFVPPNGGVASRERYTEVRFFDWQEGDAPIPEAVEFSIDVSGFPRGLGDLNEDGRVDQVSGNLVTHRSPSVRLAEDSNEAARIDSTEQVVTYRFQWNDRGQLVAVIDPERNIDRYHYYPENDPDGDGTPNVSDVITLDPLAETGYVSVVIVDAEALEDRATEHPPAALTHEYFRDELGRVRRYRNPRGVETAIEVNAHDEPVVIIRGDAVAEALVRGELKADEPPLRYSERFFYDYNGRVTRVDIPNRDGSPGDPDPAGLGDFVTRTYEFDLLNNLVQSTQESDAETEDTFTYRYDENELRVETIKPEENRDRFEYDERHLPHRAIRGAGAEEESTYTYDYDPNANVSRVSDAEDHDGDGRSESTTYTYDGHDRLSRRIDALGNEERWTYDPASNVTSRVVLGHPAGSPHGDLVRLAESRYVHDELHRICQVDDALFLDEGASPVRPVVLEDGNDDGFVSTSWEYDALSRRTFVVEDDGQVHRWSYDGADRLRRRADAAGNTREYRYDRNSNIVERVQVDVSSGSEVPDETYVDRWVYDQLDRQVRATNNAGETTYYSYDSRDNLVAMADGEGQLIEDPLSVVDGEINAPGNTVTYFYDGRDLRIRIVRELRVGGTGEGAVDTSNPHNTDGLISERRVYDRNRRLVATVDDNGNRTEYTYDALDRPVSRRFADGQEYTYEYDRDDNITRVIDPNGSVRTYRFDGLNRPTQVEVTRGAGVAGTIGQNYEYDGLSRLTRATDDNGSRERARSCSYTYDSLSRIAEEVFSGAGGAAGTPFIRADVNEDGIADITDAIAILTYLFLGGFEIHCQDAADVNADSIVDITDPLWVLRHLFLGEPPPSAPYPGCGVVEIRIGCDSSGACKAPLAGDVGVVSFRYSGDSKRLSVTYPGGRTLRSTFDTIDRAVRTEDDVSTVVEYSWMGSGYRLLRRNHGNGTVQSLTEEGVDVGYDAVERVARLFHLRPDGSAFAEREYAYNRASMCILEVRNEHNGQTDLYEYDSSYRIQATHLDTGGAGERDRAVESTEYTYDGVGNRRLQRTVRGGATTVIEYEVNEVNEYPLVGPDAYIHDENGNRTLDDRFAYRYDAFDRVVEVVDPESGETVARYDYYPDGRRAVKAVRLLDAPAASETTTRYYYDGHQVCEEQNDSGETLSTYVYAPGGLDQPVQLEMTEAHALGERAVYLHQNARGDVIAVSGPDGEVIEETLYDDFGNAVRRSGTWSGNPYLFQGRRFDEETGLYYFRFRVYDPATGRFLQRDPVDDAVNAGNLYTFVGNGPASRTDPLGLEGLESWERLRNREIARRVRQIQTILRENRSEIDAIRKAHAKLRRAYTNLGNEIAALNRDAERIGPLNVIGFDQNAFSEEGTILNRPVEKTTTAVGVGSLAYSGATIVKGVRVVRNGTLANIGKVSAFLLKVGGSAVVGLASFGCTWIEADYELEQWEKGTNDAYALRRRLRDYDRRLREELETLKDQSEKLREQSAELRDEHRMNEERLKARAGVASPFGPLKSARELDEEHCEYQRRMGNGAKIRRP